MMCDQFPAQIQSAEGIIRYYIEHPIVFLTANPSVILTSHRVTYLFHFCDSKGSL